MFGAEPAMRMAIRELEAIVSGPYYTVVPWPVFRWRVARVTGDGHEYVSVPVWRRRVAEATARLLSATS